MLKVIIGNSLLPDDYQAGDLILSFDQIDWETIQTKFEVLGYPSAWVDNTHPHCPLPGLQHYYLPNFFYLYSRQFPDSSFLGELITQKCFNLLVNKPRASRYLAMKLVEYFGLDNMYYTLSDQIVKHRGKQSNNTLQYLQDEEYNKFVDYLLAQPEISTKSNHVDHVSPRDHTGQFNYYSLWQVMLKKHCHSTAVSLLTESADHFHVQTYTEKTLQAIDAFTFPIWIGGMGSSRVFEDVYGFDVFNDVIDHSHENYKTLEQRCFYAIKNNLEILTNLELAQNMRQKHLARLQKNRDLMKTRLEQVFYSMWNAIPENIQSQIRFEVQRPLSIWG